MKRIDLHIHTTASDGTMTPSEVVSEAMKLHLSAIAITDHDTVSGISEAVEAAGNHLEIVPGIEFSTKYHGPVHILGYFVDPQNDTLLTLLDTIVRDRDVRNEQIISAMQKDGIDIDYATMKARFGEVIGRPHLATILVENGIASDVRDAFSNYVGKGMRYWFPRTTVPMEDCIRTVLEAGGIPVLAHPFEYDYSEKSLCELIELCISFGLEGIECRHSSHTPGQMMYLEQLAAEYGLLKTGGSDFHGTVKKNIQLGTGSGLVSVPDSWLEALKKAQKIRGVS